MQALGPPRVYIADHQAIVRGIGDLDVARGVDRDTGGLRERRTGRRPASPENAGAPVPAIVVMVPLVRTLRARLEPSEMYK